MDTKTKDRINTGLSATVVVAFLIGAGFALAPLRNAGVDSPIDESNPSVVEVFRGVGAAPEADPTPTPTPSETVVSVEPAPVEEAPAPEPPSGLPAGSPVPFIPSSDPNNAAGGDYDVSQCASGTASTVDGIPTCD